jgi:cytochrome c-type biogenesis protein CcmH/NrfG
MARVSLRVYIREIESLIDQGATNEAIAHSRHILRTFPKHLETYRLLGKSYLESHRYGEAVDVFSRVLMSVPDDFVSHVGMSIINDEQNRLDDSIWHMERAFESQPSNAAIQGELQRLYGRRDGMEPPKVRMTRGALAHMYIQGELYPQAIAEIRAVLGQDPQRADMQVLLARAYFKSGQKADAAQMCTQLLKSYPYCFDANRIMVELSPSSVGAPENTQVYRTRVGELDPYVAVSKGSVYQTNEVPDNAINLERLEYTGDEGSAGQDWRPSLGIGLSTSSNPELAASTSSDQPDWLKGFTSVEQTSTSDPFAAVPSAATPQNEIPDFLRTAGWGESTGPEQPTSFFDTPDPAAGGALAPADIPDWLKGQAPSEPVQSFTPPPAASEPSLDTPDWLAGLGGGQFSESPIVPSDQPNQAPDWLGGLGGVESAPAQPAASIPSSDTPDWLSSLGGAQAAEPVASAPSESPDWLSGLGGGEQSAPPANMFESTEPAQSLSSDDTPDWLSNLGGAQTDAPVESTESPDWLGSLGGAQPMESTPAAADDTADWLSNLGNAGAAEPVKAGDMPDWLGGLGNEPLKNEGPATEQLGEPAETPDWLKGLGGSQPAQSAASIENLGASAQEQDDAVAWLESLAAKHGAKPEELVTDPNKRSETPPNWVQQAQEVGASQPAQPAASIESLGASAQEQDDAVAWLESLAAKHGAKPEELVTDPNKRSETPPEWVEQARAVSQSQPAQSPAASIEELGSSAQEQDDAVAWLESLAAKHGAKPEELVTDPNKRSETPPDWVQQARDAAEAQPVQSNQWSENAQNIGEQFFNEFEDAAEAAPAADETGMWLKAQEEKEQQNTPVAGLPDWMSDENEQTSAAAKTDLPDWLGGMQDETSPEAPHVEHLSRGDLSDWLSGLDEEPAAPPVAPTARNDLPDWLSTVDAEAQKSSDAWTPEAATVPAEEPAPAEASAELPGWLQSMDDEPTNTEPSLKPTSPSDWHPAETTTESLAPRMADLGSRPVRPAPKKPSAAGPASDEPVYESIDKQDDWEPEPEERPVFESRKPPITPMPLTSRPTPAQPPVQPVQPAMQSQPPAPKVSIPPAQTPAQPPAPKPATPRKTGMKSETQPSSSALVQAKGELDRGDIPAALEHYGKLIKKGKHLEDTIRDLSDSIYRYPVEVGIWQTLGDAYMRANRLKEALEAYNKAEELIR